MSAQARDAQVPALEGEALGPAYGATSQVVSPRRPELPNGIPPRAADPGREVVAERAAAIAAPVETEEFDAGQRTRMEAVPVGGARSAERPFLSPESQGPTASARSIGPPGSGIPEPELSRDTTRTLDVEVTYGPGGD